MIDSESKALGSDECGADQPCSTVKKCGRADGGVCRSQ